MPRPIRAAGRTPAPKPAEALTKAQARKLEDRQLINLRNAMYGRGWQERRQRDPAFAQRMSVLEGEYQRRGADDWARHVVGPPSTSKMELGELYREHSRLWSKGVRPGDGNSDARRLKALDHELYDVRRAKLGYRDAGAFEAALRAMVDD